MASSDHCAPDGRVRLDMISDAKSPHIYVVSETGEPEDRVKIGMVYANGSRSGRPGLNAGNWRQLKVLHRYRLPETTVRWHEFVIHQHLRPFEIRGEWFDVSSCRRRSESWQAFLERAYDCGVRGGDAVDLGTDDHHLEAIRVTSRQKPRRFVADCSCGHKFRASGTTLPAVYKRFLTEHVAPTR